jgi:DNA-binding GntR family transcriptional regulator
MDKALPTLESPKTLNERVLDALSDAIVKGDLEPGQPLITAEIAEHLGVSRTPVRTAVLQLEQLGLLSLTGNNRYLVPPLSLGELENLYAVREVIEGLAARLAAPLMSHKQVSMLEEYVAKTFDLIESTGTLVALKQPERFHQVILEVANNTELTRIHYQVFLKIQRYRLAALAKVKPTLLRGGLDEHRAILNALAAHDAQLAEKCAREHVIHAKERLAAGVRLLGATPSSA